MQPEEGYSAFSISEFFCRPLLLIYLHWYMFRPAIFREEIPYRRFDHVCREHQAVTDISPRKERPKVFVAHNCAATAVGGQISVQVWVGYRKGKTSLPPGATSPLPHSIREERSPDGIATDLMPEWLAVADEFQIWIFFQTFF